MILGINYQFMTSIICEVFIIKKNYFLRRGWKNYFLCEIDYINWMSKISLDSVNIKMVSKDIG
jgi:hypothetical protein